MPLYHNNQAGNAMSVEMSSTDAVRSLTRSRKQIALKSNGDGTWSLNIHDGLGYKAFTGTYYTPPFAVRAVNLCDDTESVRKIHYDEAGDGDMYKLDTEVEKDTYQMHIIETFSCNSLIPVHLTRVYLDSFTTATEIHLHG